MANQIIKQPNGMYCIFSSIQDDFIIQNATLEQIINELAREYREKIEDKVNNIAAALDAGKKPYFQFTMTYEDAMKKAKKE